MMEKRTAYIFSFNATPDVLKFGYGDAGRTQSKLKGEK
jgi:hypothetical protein